MSQFLFVINIYRASAFIVNFKGNLLLFCNTHAYVGLEFHSEVALIMICGMLPDECLVKFCDVGFLLDDKVSQLFDSVHGLYSAVAVYFGLLFLLPEPEDLVGDSIVILLVVGLLEELLL